MSIISYILALNFDDISHRERILSIAFPIAMSFGLVFFLKLLSYIPILKALRKLNTEKAKSEYLFSFIKDGQKRYYYVPSEQQYKKEVTRNIIVDVFENFNIVKHY